MRSYRSVFISDVHLGTADCQADYLLDFLNKVRCQTLYLVGDIIDLIAMQRRAHFPDSHRQVIHRLLELAATGTRVVYIPGNHDEFFRRFCGQTFSGIELQYKAVHTTADGRQFLVCHGDQFDQVVRCSPLMLLVGDRAHIHSAGFLRSEDGLYCNDGDWVEHCTALVERGVGKLELLHWSESPVTLSREPEHPNPELAGHARPVIDALPAAFLEQLNGLVR
uniref:Calcineurin-like phosphoesterase domain-containing protein n=1 Tax=Marinobacter nauticus TaxID=2743 RepID=A0A455W0R0_MARNT|nr:hypothetical protein YBY_01790 [Marinobacter nauticus]